MAAPAFRLRCGRFAHVLRGIPPRAVLAAAWGWLVLYAYPGLFTQDSFDHLNEARSGVYTDAHPPFINFLWRHLDHLVSGPFGMLALQSSMLLFGLYLFVRRAVEPRPAAWITLAIFVFPPVMLPMAVIWKDCLMAGSLMLGIAALLSPRRGLRYAGLAAMFFASAVRYNALAATFAPILLLFEHTPGLRWYKRYPIALGTWLAISIAALALNAGLTDKPMYYWHSSLAVYDIAGTLVHRAEDLSDPEAEELLAGTGVRQHVRIVPHMRAVYTTTNFASLVGDGPTRLWNLPTGGTVPAPQPQRDAIAAAWRETVTSYPAAYLAHRAGVMVNILGITNRRIPGAVVERTPPFPEYMSQTMGLSVRSSPVQESLTRAAFWIVAHIPIFTPWTYLAVLLLLLPLAWRQRDTLALLLSGVGLEASLFVLAPSSDYRYSHWMIVATVTASLLYIARRRCQRSSR